MANSGKYFEYETTKALRGIRDHYKEFMWFRVQDTQMLRYATGNEKYIANTVPCDFLAFNSGKPHFIECKSSMNPVSYRLEYIKSHQLESLIDAERCGCTSWFLLNCRKRKLGSNTAPLRVWAVKPMQIAEYINADMKSVKWSQLDVDGIQIKKDKEGRWDLKKILGLTKSDMEESSMRKKTCGISSPSNQSKDVLKSLPTEQESTPLITGRRFRIRLRGITQH